MYSRAQLLGQRFVQWKLTIQAGWPYIRVTNKCTSFMIGTTNNWPYKRVDLTSVDHISGLDCTSSDLGYFHLLSLTYSRTVALFICCWDKLIVERFLVDLLKLHSLLDPGYIFQGSNSGSWIVIRQKTWLLILIHFQNYNTSTMCYNSAFYRIRIWIRNHQKDDNLSWDPDPGPES